jgi:serine-type D-Ala-D-Ala carboxypeptidase/endopeptidase
MSVAAESPDWSETTVRQLLQDRVEKAKRSVGIAVALIDAQGERFVNFGSYERNGKKPIEADTIFEIGSISKVFTATLLQARVARGEMKLDDPVAKYLPPGSKVPSRGDRQITLLDLATHRSGLPRMPANLRFKDATDPYAGYTVKQLLDFLAGYQLTRDIGATFEYSNLGASVLGLAITTKAGRSYEQLVLDEICRPLKMESTRITLGADLRARFTPGHSAEGQTVSAWDLGIMSPAGGLRSTTRDMAKFVAANLGLTEGPLKEIFAETHRGRAEAGKGEVALAWHITHQPGADIVWHNGGTGGFRSFAGLDLKARRGVVVLSNAANSVDDLGLHLLLPSFPLEGATPKTTPTRKEHVLTKIDPALYDVYAGEYRFPTGQTLTVRHEGERFTVQMTKQQPIEIFPESDADFFCKVVDAQLTFVRTEKGEATAVILHQNGFDQRAERTPAK